MKKPAKRLRFQYQSGATSKLKCETRLSKSGTPASQKVADALPKQSDRNRMPTDYPSPPLRKVAEAEDVEDIERRKMMAREIGLTPKAQKQLDAEVDCYTEAFRLLRIIDAEFRSDPMSTQCFDLRIVERVRKCVERRAELEKEMPWLKDA